MFLVKLVTPSTRLDQRPLNRMSSHHPCVTNTPITQWLARWVKSASLLGIKTDTKHAHRLNLVYPATVCVVGGVWRVSSDSSL